MYVGRTYEEILSELQDLSNSTLAKTEGTFSHDILSSNSLEFAKLELEIAAAYKNSFGDTCESTYLDLRASEFGVIRREAKKSIGEVRVTGSGTVYKDSVFSTQNNIRFVATRTVQVDGSATIPIEAVEAGSAGNVPIGAINKIPMNIVGIKSCVNDAATYDGYDVESDETLRERFLLKARYPAASGSPAHYREWASAIVGVGAVRVWRCWNGAGTVKVILIDSNFEAANVELIQRVVDAIETERPVGAIVTVVSAEIVPVDISCNIIGDFNLENFKAACENYFKKLINDSLFQNEYTLENYDKLPQVSISRINALLIDSGGADDILNLKINNQTENIRLNLDEIPRIGELNFS